MFMKNLNTKAVLIAVITILQLNTFVTYAQYFGRNKPSYKKFRFEVARSPHFEIHHYLKNDTMINYFTGWAEEWYHMHQRIFKDTFRIKTPLFFMHTMLISSKPTPLSIIAEGTGGVTESLKQRVIMPLHLRCTKPTTCSGHELVHAFSVQ